MRRGLVGAVGSGWHEARHGAFARVATVHLVRQGSSMIGEDGACDRLEQDAVLVRGVLPDRELAARLRDAARMTAAVQRLAASPHFAE